MANLCSSLTNSPQTCRSQGCGILGQVAWLPQHHAEEDALAKHDGQRCKMHWPNHGFTWFVWLYSIQTDDNQGSSTDGTFDGIKKLLYFLRCENDAMVIFNLKKKNQTGLTELHTEIFTGSIR